MSSWSKKLTKLWPVAVILAALLTAGLTWWVQSASGDGASFSASIAWPSSLSVDQSMVVLATVVDEEGAALGSGDVTLYGLPGLLTENLSWSIVNEEIAEALQDDDRRVVLGKGSLKNGIASLSVPPVSTWARDDADDGSDYLLVLQVKKGFQTRHIRINLPVHHSDKALALTLDRPLYQPGQTIMMRAVVVDDFLGRPIGEAEAHWQIRDPQGNLVFDHRAPTSKNGVAATQFELAGSGQQGDYKIAVSVGEKQATQTVSVLPFRLPRFTVSVDPGRVAAEPGAQVSFRLSARYTHGEAVAGASVQARLFWQTWDNAEQKVIDGRLDAEGVFVHEWEAPADLRPGSSVRINGRVTTDAGRAEEAGASLRVARSQPQIEIYQLGRGYALPGQVNEAVVVVTDARGAPMADQSVTIYLPETSGRTLDVRTDESGRAVFEWTPSESTATRQVRLQARLVEHAMSLQSVDVSVRDKPFILRANSPAARAGEPYVFGLDAHEEPLVVAIVGEWGPLEATVLAPSKTAYEHEIVFPDAARGLSQLMVWRSQVLVDTLPVWVRQGSTSQVGVVPEASHYKPGATAHVDLSFPVLTKVAGESPVTFGLLGVDEALYALKERADVPFEVLLRQVPEVVTGLLPMLDGLEEADSLGQRIITARFLSTLTELPEQKVSAAPWTYNGIDFSRAVIEKENERLGVPVMVLILLVLYGLLALGLRMTWSSLKWRMVTMRHLGLSFSVGCAAGIGAFVLGTVMGFSGLSVVVSLSILALLILLLTSSNTYSELPAFGWFLTIAAVVALVYSGGNFYDAIYTEEHLVLVIVLLIVIPACTVLASAAAWVFILHDWEESIPALVLSGLLGALIIGAGLAVFVTAFVSPIEDRFRPAPYSGVKFNMASEPGYAFDDVEVEEDGFADDFEVVNRARQVRSAPPPSSAAPMEVLGRAGGGGARSRAGGPSEMDEAEGEAKPEAPRARKAQGAESEGGVRSWFPETMVWMPDLDSDTDGNLRVSFPVPDSMTTWRLDAYAHTRDGRFGQGQAGLLVTRPVFVELDLPTHLTDGDQIQIPATLVNHGEEPLDVRMAATTDGALEVEPLAQTQWSVAPRSRVVITLLVKANGVGSGELTVSAYGAGGMLLDGEQRKTTVAPHGRRLEETVSGIILDGTRHEFTLPDEAIQATPAVTVSIHPGNVADAFDGLDGMLRQPYGCFEQTSSVNYPNTLILQVLKATDPGAWPGGAGAWRETDEKARNFLHLGYQRVLTFQDSSGGFALYPRQRPELLLTAYGVVQLVDMSEVHPVDPQVIARAIGWLTRLQQRDGSWRPDGHRNRGGIQDGTMRTTALVAMGMLRAETSSSAASRALNYIEQNMDAVTSDHTLALMANALHLGGRDAAARKVFGRLASRMSGAENRGFIDDVGPTWMGGRGSYARIETTAMTANAFLTAGVHQEFWEPMLNFIAANRASWGGWGTTQATVWSLMALKNMRSAPGHTEINVQLAGKPMSHAAGDERPGQMMIDSEVALMRAFREEGLSGGKTALTIMATQSSPAMYRATAEYAVPWTSRLAAGEEGIQLTLNVPARQMSIHTNHQVLARLTNTTGTPLDTLIAELPIPPGAFVSRDQFEELVANRTIDHFEVLPTHVRVYLAGLAARQTLTIEYSFAPMLRGEMVLPPLRAYQFYTPRPLFEIDGGPVAVP